jgi:hypothetical protein
MQVHSAEIAFTDGKGFRMLRSRTHETPQLVVEIIRKPCVSNPLEKSHDFMDTAVAI